jgi:hypothetical protein
MDRRSFIGVLGAAAAGLGLKTAARAQPTVLDEFFVAGYRFHDGPLVERSLAEGGVIEVRREPDNPHDERAIALHLGAAKVGYVPRRCNRPLAALLDAGAPLRFRVVAVAPEAEPWGRVAVVAELLLEGVA